MGVKASGGSPIVKPQLYRTALLSTIIQAEQQDRFLETGELSQLVAFLNSGSKRLQLARILTQNANILVARAADKIFTGGSAISYLERPQTSILTKSSQSTILSNQQLSGNIQDNALQGLVSLFNISEAAPPGFKPIDVTKYGNVRMRKSLRDLDWFLRYLTYAIIAGDPNILSVNIRGLRELIDNACSSAAAIVALREMRKTALSMFNLNLEDQILMREYFNVIIKEFESPAYTDKLKKRSSNSLQGLRLPQTYVHAGTSIPRFVMKTSLSENEKIIVIKACYRQVFERDISKAYSLSFSDLESQLKIGKLSVKEFIRGLGLSTIYRKQFFEPFVNSRVVELAFRHFLGRGLSSIEEFQIFFSILSEQGLTGLVNSLINSEEYTDYFNEETVPYLRNLGEDPQECKNWGPQIDLFNYSAPLTKIPQFITLFSNYNQTLPDQHPYGKCNEPLNIQFGAIFPEETRNYTKKIAFFSKYSRRILIRKGPGIYNQLSNPSTRSKLINLESPKIFQLIPKTKILSSITDSYVCSTGIVINAAYLRVFGRLVYKEERLLFKSLESKFESLQISVQEFVRQLAKSSVFRKLYWESLYICKSIEYIHNRLLGRPTYGRQEINQYFDIVYKKGYYILIDSMIDSTEYLESFGDNIVPYDRYVTSSSLVSRNRKIYLNNQNQRNSNQNNAYDKFIELGTIKSNLSTTRILSKTKQGVDKSRYQSTIFLSDQQSSLPKREKVFRVCFRQLFEKNSNLLTVGNEISLIEKSFINKQITVKQLVFKLGINKLYQKEFYQPYPNTKVIEFGTKHFLGRAPNNQAEIRYYNQILASQGLPGFIESLVYSIEYDTLFGNYLVPYRRFPTLPAANFPNTGKLYNYLQGQNNKIVSLNFS